MTLPLAMSAYRTFAIAGTAGVLGASLRKAFASSSPRILTRGDPPAAVGNETFHTVDYSQLSTLVDALDGIDVLVSCLSASARDAEQNLARAAKIANVKLFVPSGFGADLRELQNRAGGSSPHPAWAGKIELQDFLENDPEVKGLPYLQVVSVLFASHVFKLPMGFNLEENKVTIVGSGDEKIALTTQEDTAAFLYKALTTLPPSELEYKTLRLSCSRRSWNDLISLIETKKGIRLEKEMVSVEDALKFCRENDSGDDFVAGLGWGLLWILGSGQGDVVDDNAKVGFRADEHAIDSVIATL